ncbi:hypothetical protein O7630_28190 [Micromonospora sp. WMMD718]|uniref:hypothetical protein n=1 Tax=Micromonospora sp. WMMD718 TaxID=3016098 RepID=UPI0024165998|nr:hypothetical protein [Micromonospora sp. WMMD718]MDG4754828.1 hypothetical protein [Micromonospora sp. WMMD718]
MNLEMSELYAVDYGVESPEAGPLRPMDMRPLLDALAARWDSCHGCLTHHLNLIAADPPLTTHLVAAALCALNIREASARLLLQALDPDGCALALTIRNSGPEVAAQLAESMGPERRQVAASIALNIISPTGWLDSPVSNLTPPFARVPDARLGDADMLSDLRADGHL